MKRYHVSLFLLGSAHSNSFIHEPIKKFIQFLQQEVFPEYQMNVIVDSFLQGM